MSRFIVLLRPLATAACVGAALVAPPRALSAEDDNSPAVHTVKKREFKLEVSLSGVIEAENMTPVSIEAESWKSLTVLEAVEHGARVKQGDSLLKLDMEGIDEAIAELENAQEVSELSLALARAELKSLEKMTPLELAAAERAKQTAEEDLKRFLKEQRPLSERMPASRSSRRNITWNT